jgi:hypothetical protein
MQLPFVKKVWVVGLDTSVPGVRALTKVREPDTAPSQMSGGAGVDTPTGAAKWDGDLSSDGDGAGAGNGA